MVRVTPSWGTSNRANYLTADITALGVIVASGFITGTLPTFSQPNGDVWMAVHDCENAWISAGTSYPEPAAGNPAVLMCRPQ